MEVLPTIVIERVLDIAFAAAILLGAVSVVVSVAGALRLAVVIGGLVIVGLIVFYLPACSCDWVLNLFNRLTSRWTGL